MRWIVVVGFLLTLAAPAWTAAAQATIACLTVNGSRSLDQITEELLAAGYSGPWDGGSRAEAYGRASGGTVDCGEFGWRPDAASSSGVVLLPGVLTYSQSTTFSSLKESLYSRGYANADVWDYSYAGVGNSYTWMDTCQDLGLSESRLHDALLGIRARRGPAYSVTLVGHSLGGVVALETAIRYPDVRPMIRSVVTVDSPLMGISGFKEQQWLAWYGLKYCSAMDGLIPRNQSKATTNAWLREGAQKLLNRGIWVSAIVNTGDNLFIAAHGDQGIEGVNVNVVGTWLDSGANHNAVLNTADGIQAVLRSIPN